MPSHSTALRASSLTACVVIALAACGTPADDAAPATTTSNVPSAAAVATGPTAPPDASTNPADTADIADSSPTTAPPTTASPATEPSSSPTVPTPAVLGTTVPAEPVVVPPALRFTGELVGGGTLDMSTLANLPTVLWFWAPWCSICNAEAESVEAAAQRWAGRANFVGVAWSGNDDQFGEFIERHALSFPQLSDDAGQIFVAFEVPAQPAFAFVTATGEVETLLGAADDELLDAIIAAALET